MKLFKTRLELAEQFEGIGVEVGVADGWFSNRILLNSKVNLLLSIDPYGGQGESHLSTDELYLQAYQTLSVYGKRSAIIRQSSEVASKIISDDSLDFCYIDANHSYEECKADIERWYPKVKEGGYFCGHDYCDFHKGVKKAVDETGWAFSTTELDFMYEGYAIRSWYFRV